MEIPPLHNNNFYICTSIGRLIHLERDGLECKFRYMDIHENEVINVNGLSIHGDVQEIVLVCYANGEIRMFHTNYGITL